MGGGESTTGAAPPFLGRPWSDILWEDRSSALQYVKDYKPQTEGQQLRILLYGPVGAGKSSFINSVQSVLQGRMYTQALADNTSYECFTKRYATCKIPKGSPKTFYPFVLNEIMGLYPHKGVLVDDVKLAMVGHMKDGYTFDSESTLSDLRPNAFYNEHPTDNDKVHVLVCVVPANTVSLMRPETVQKIREIRMEATKLGIPQVAILTKIDQACPEIKDDLKKVYKLKYLKEKMEEFSADVGIPMNCIYLVKNYHEEINLNSDVDSLILSSLKSIINFGDDFINFRKTMGADPSNFEAGPQLLGKPWRVIKWEDRSSALQDVKNYKPQTEGQQLRILLHGPVGAGKSSFINSVQSVLQGRMYTHALVDNTSGHSFTRRYTTYKIPKGNPKIFYPFVFNDIMGLDPTKGVLVKDVKLAMMGHMKDGYTFNPESPLTDLRPNAFYNEIPTDNDKVHVLVCVVPANTVSQVRDETVQKIRKIRMEATKLGIPQVAILTKIDEACPEIKDDLKNVYKLKYLKEKMEEFSADVGIPMNCIFPVKNYHEEIDLNSDIDSLILSSLKSTINFGDDFINSHNSQPEASDTSA
ncbi:uncharacterized protein LOC119476544 isoform X2 [Sebastes umbrosus]|uniref:uncharacterized protein LOC119476544 isoform X2 n=1 Tax=Sebastes umbrosus TaxID=72105 RepID=UPI00189C792A|nr:uncharacterized protein LOC119476544 isoform X2 [Sebastes umbrosus]XP_037605846.1 uncharacterized protein LOC119476544 isoform X2 [Sebastes umbrosus]